MADYIKRSDAIDYIEDFVLMNKYYHPYSKRTTIPIAEAIARINETPSADVAEVRHGKWELAWSSNVYKCSLCKFKYRYIDNFCPNCGADMRGGT